MAWRACGVVLAVTLARPVHCAHAENIVFPPDAGILDVKRDYAAVGDGKTDDTDALQAALDDGGQNRIVYLPNGTYLISRQLRFPPADQETSAKGGHKRTILQGQSRDGVTIQLADETPGFREVGKRTDPKTGRTIYSGHAMIWTGTAPAQRFRNAIRNLTIDIGRGNRAATGIQFVANNQGCVRDVTIRSREPTGGFIGLDLGYTGQNGPLLVERVTVEGFDVGIDARAFNSATLVDVRVTGYRGTGIRSNGCLFARSLTTSGTGSAIAMEKRFSNLVLIDSELHGVPEDGGIADAAIWSAGRFYLARVTTIGFPESFMHVDEDLEPQTRRAGDTLTAVSHPLPDESLPEIPEFEAVPEVEWDDDFFRWSNPMDFGAAGDGRTDDTAAIQRAVDVVGKTTLYFPADRKFCIKGEVILRGTIARVVGCEGTLRRADYQRGDDASGWFVVRKGVSPVVVIERLDTMYSGVGFRNESTRTLVLSSLGGTILHSGAGRTFLSDFVGRVELHHPDGQMQGDSVNTESDRHVNTLNRGGRLKILGLKTENRHVKVATTRGGITHILGTHVYSNTTKPPDQPLLSVDDASMLTIVGHRETWFGRDIPYRAYVRTPDSDRLRVDFPGGRYIPALTVPGLNAERTSESCPSSKPAP